MTTIYGYTKCSTVAKARKYLDSKEVEYTHIDNVANPLSAKEIKELHETSGLDIKKFFNTSGMKYRELGLKDKLPEMSLEEKYELLASDGMLVKRPILRCANGVTVGFKVDTWDEML